MQHGEILSRGVRFANLIDAICSNIIHFISHATEIKQGSAEWTATVPLASGENAREHTEWNKK
jgi:hypothetical protein